MSSPGPVVAVVMIYLVFVLKIGPEYMKNRKPMDLKRIMVLYNAFQVCYSIWMCRTVSQHTRRIHNNLPYISLSVCLSLSPFKRATSCRRYSRRSAKSIAHANRI